MDQNNNKFPFFIIVSLVIILAIVLGFHAKQDLMVIYPSGWVGIQERNLMLLVSFIMLLIVIPVLVMTIYYGWKYQAHRKEKHEPEAHQNHLLEVVWWGVPCIIIIFFSIWTWQGSHKLDPYKPLQSDVKPLNIQVVALNWKWLFIYPEEGIASVNFFQFPENRPLHFDISADAPMNSFWLPALGGQIYAMAGMRSELNLIANHTGVFRGQSANISGEGFAGMVFNAKSSTESEYQEWLSVVKGSGKTLDLNSYNELAKPTSYVPVSYYSLGDKSLFDQIIMKYMGPQHD